MSESANESERDEGSLAEGLPDNSSIVDGEGASEPAVVDSPAGGQTGAGDETSAAAETEPEVAYTNVADARGEEQVHAEDDPPAGIKDPFSEHKRAGPWKRCFARQIDLVVPSIAGVGLAIAFSAQYLWVFALMSLLPVLLWIVPEALLLAYLGNTPGKWLMGLRLVTPDGASPLLDNTLRRSVSVAVKGMAMNIPLLNIFAPIRAYQRLRNRGITSWDEGSGFQVVEQRTVGPVQAVVVLLLAMLITFGGTQFMTSSLAGQGIALARSQADENMSPVRNEFVRLMEDYGVELKQVGDPFVPLIAAGEVVSHTIALEEGEGRLALATCDAECRDLDLLVVGPDGSVIAEDFESDAEPVALFLAPEAGDYTIMLELPRCITESCLALLELHDIAGYSFENGGTCFVVSDEGHVLTSKHVVEGSDTITVTLGDGRLRMGELAEELPEDDVALLRVDARTPEFLRLATTPLRLGGPVMTLGFPLTDLLGNGAKYSEGSIAALNGPEGDPYLFQMSAQVQPGSSGGPVLDRDGDVVGLVTAIADDGVFFEETGSIPQGINWATKAYRFRDLVPPPGRRSPVPRSLDIVEQSRRAVCRIEARFEARGR